MFLLNELKKNNYMNFTYRIRNLKGKSGLRYVDMPQLADQRKLTSISFVQTVDTV